jgi:GNAT superfamily N-acetyltransferase
LRLIAVAADAQGQGIGAALLVSDFNIAAQRVYQRRGYQQVGTLPGLVLPDVDELCFWKRLLPQYGRCSCIAFGSSPPSSS